MKWTGPESHQRASCFSRYFITATVGCRHSIYAQQTEPPPPLMLSLPSSLFFSPWASCLMSLSIHRPSFIFLPALPLFFSLCFPLRAFCLGLSYLTPPLVFLIYHPPSQAQEFGQWCDCPSWHQVGGGSPVWGSGRQTSSHDRVVGASRRQSFDQHHERARRHGDGTQRVSAGPYTGRQRQGSDLQSQPEDTEAALGLPYQAICGV